MTYTIATHYYMHYLSRKSKILETENWKQKLNSGDYFN